MKWTRACLYWDLQAPYLLLSGLPLRQLTNLPSTVVDPRLRVVWRAIQKGSMTVNHMALVDDRFASRS